MSEREEYTPDLGSIRAWYAGAVDEYRCDTGMSMDEGEAAFDRAIAAYEQKLRKKIARDIEARREHFIAETTPALGDFPTWTDAYLNGLDDAIDVARGEDQTDE